MKMSGSAPAANASSISEQLAQLFPCSNPVNPHMRSEAARLQTFRDRSDEWLVHRIAATPEQMSQAGLYYLGERDRVKCWYCNGGLQNWARFDNPWFEHAKWFPTCEYLLQKKGPVADTFLMVCTCCWYDKRKQCQRNQATKTRKTSPKAINSQAWKTWHAKVTLNVLNINRTSFWSQHWRRCWTLSCDHTPIMWLHNYHVTLSSDLV